MRAAIGVLLVGVVTLAGALALIAGLRPPPPTPAREPSVKLAVLIVFDQLRGDMLQRWQPLFRTDGFARLQRDGAWFTHCYYPYGTTTTGPGHASLLTGTCGDVHGIINNNWMENGLPVYCAGADRYELVPPLPVFPKDGKGKTSTKKEPKEIGTPERLRSETVADVLKEATHQRAKVFGLSLKDRSAILPTGQRPDGAYWFYGVFGTSTYYRDTVHPWVKAFNESRWADRWFGHDWTRLRPDIDYQRWSSPDHSPGEGTGVAQGVAFPHPTTGGSPTLGLKYYEALANSPFGNDLLWEFAKTCIRAEQLGNRDVADLLVISFSSNDLIGHTWGPDSQEVLDVTLRSDALMADILDFLDRQVGRDRYLLALTADHGICPLTQRSYAQGLLPKDLRVDATQLQNAVNDHLNTVFPTAQGRDGSAAKWVEAVVLPWFYLNPRVVKASGQSPDIVHAEAAKFLATQEGVARVFTRQQLAGPIAPSDEIAQRMKRSFDPERSGDFAVVLVPYALPGKPGSTGTTHGAPYNYDRHVPLLVYGPGIRGGIRTEPTTPQAIASIFAEWLQIRRPQHAEFPIPTTLRETPR